jgi:hypothetical protein
MRVRADIETSSVATGIADVVGNKGGVGVGLTIGSTSVAFINCHLAGGRCAADGRVDVLMPRITAHQTKVELRNADYHKIHNRIALRRPDAEERESWGDIGEDDEHSLLRRFDIVFWAGDMNYRVDGPRHLVDRLLAQDPPMLEVMRANDQLAAQRAKGRVFRGFAEGAVEFPPTYKFDAGTDAYDTSEKKRVPSWTDRVLFKPCAAVRLKRYDSVRSLRTSDHRPVLALFEIDTAPPVLGEAATVASPDAQGSSSADDAKKRDAPADRPPEGAAPSPPAEVKVSVLEPAVAAAPLPGPANAADNGHAPTTAAKVAPAAAAAPANAQALRSEKRSAVCAVQ